MWRVWANDFTAADFTGTSKYQTLKPNKNIILRAVRTWIVVYNDPVFTNCNMKIYSNTVVGNDNKPKALLATSTDVRTKAEIITDSGDTNGVREVYFTFNDVPLNGNTDYNFVINGTGYSPTASSFLAWMHGFPDSVYTQSQTFGLSNVQKTAYQLYLASGGEF